MAKKSVTRRYRSRPGPNPLPEEEKRLLFTISLANKLENGGLLNCFREAVEHREGGNISREQLIEIAKQQCYLGIAAYCQQVEREIEAISGDL